MDRYYIFIIFCVMISVIILKVVICNIMLIANSYRIQKLTLNMSAGRSYVTKDLLLVRHGTTEMNEALSRRPWGSDDFIDPLLYDTRLSQNGIKQAKDIHNKLINSNNNKINFNNVDLLITSPLTRTLQTTNILFNSNILPLASNKKLVHPLLRERLYLSSDIGRVKSELVADFPDFDYSYLPDDSWWYTNNDSNFPINNISNFPYSTNNSNDCNKYIEWRPPGEYVCPGEPTEVFRLRMKQLREFLLLRPEKFIIVVAHWGVLRALTGLQFKNCEMIRISSDKLYEEPYIDSYN